MPHSLAPSERRTLQALAARSRDAIVAGDGRKAVASVREFRAMLARLGVGGGPLEDCGDHCQHHLDDGNPTAYAVCCWACVIRGGPGLVAPPAGPVLGPAR